MSTYHLIITGCMVVWALFWVLEIVCKIRDSRHSKGCRHDGDDGFGLSFIRIGGRCTSDHDEDRPKDNET